MTVTKRQEWGGKIEFILTCVGYAIGLGNIWRFPYLCFKNGGGAFLIPYLLMNAFVGIPLYYMELSFGQFASLGPISIWEFNIFLKGVGIASTLTNMVIFIYYNVILSWCIFYLFASMSSTLPWTTCGNLWNTPNCMSIGDYDKMIVDNDTFLLNGTILPKNLITTPSEEYFYRKVLQLSTDGIENYGTIVWQLALCLFLGWLIVFLVLIKGISSLGKVVYFTSVFPYILLTIMLVRGVTLEGALEGIIFYLKPDWNKLLEASVWSDAATQIFFSLSTCSGGLVAMASYNKFHNNCFRDAMIVPIINTLTSLYGGFAIFSVLGYMAVQKGTSVDQVAASGPGLMFIVYPEGLSTMPIGPLWSILFFLMMLTLGLSSLFSMVESFFCAFMDEFPNLLRNTQMRTYQTRFFFITIFFILGLSMVFNGGFYLFALLDGALSGFPLLITGLFEIIAINHIYGIRNFSKDIEMMLGKKPVLYFQIMWFIITPLIFIATIFFLAFQYKPVTLFSGKYIYPRWADVLTLVIVGLCLLSIPVNAIVIYCRKGGFEILKQVNRPGDKWGPAMIENQTDRYKRK